MLLKQQGSSLELSGAAGVVGGQTRQGGSQEFAKVSAQFLAGGLG